MCSKHFLFKASKYRVIDIFLQNLESSGKYVKTIIDEFPSVVYSVEDDDMGGELREELLKLNLK